MDGPSPTTLTRWTAIIAGIVGFICFVITPFLPVVNTQSSVSWPQRDTLNSVDAPLMAQAPLDLSVDLPLSLTDELSDKRTTLLSTIPPTADKPTKRGLMVRSGKDGLDVILRDSVVMSLDKKELASNKGKILESAQTSMRPPSTSTAPRTQMVRSSPPSHTAITVRRSPVSTLTCPLTATRPRP